MMVMWSMEPEQSAALEEEIAQLRADLAEAGLHAKVCLDACNEAKAESDQLRADKAELLAAIKPALDVVENPYRFSDDDAAAAYDNLKAVFATFGEFARAV